VFYYFYNFIKTIKLIFISFFNYTKIKYEKIRIYLKILSMYREMFNKIKQNANAI